jgi:hypothetical protein
VDVAALLGRYTLEQLCELAAEKDAGFDRRVFADAFAAAAHSDAAFAELGLGPQLWPPYGRARLDGARPTDGCRGHVDHGRCAVRRPTDATGVGGSWPSQLAATT